MKKTINAIIVSAGIAASASVAADDFNTVVAAVAAQPVSSQVQVVNPDNIAGYVQRNNSASNQSYEAASASISRSIEEYARSL